MFLHDHKSTDKKHELGMSRFPLNLSHMIASARIGVCVCYNKSTVTAHRVDWGGWNAAVRFHHLSRGNKKNRRSCCGCAAAPAPSSLRDPISWPSFPLLGLWSITSRHKQTRCFFGRRINWSPLCLRNWYTQKSNFLAVRLRESWLPFAASASVSLP